MPWVTASAVSQILLFIQPPHHLLRSPTRLLYTSMRLRISMLKHPPAPGARHLLIPNQRFRNGSQHFLCKTRRNRGLCCLKKRLSVSHIFTFLEVAWIGVCRRKRTRNQVPRHLPSLSVFEYSKSLFCSSWGDFFRWCVWGAAHSKGGVLGLQHLKWIVLLYLRNRIGWCLGRACVSWSVLCSTTLK